MTNKSMVQIIIDGKAFSCKQSDIITKVANKNKIFIPTLCATKKVKPHGACGICVVEIKGQNKLFRACSTKVSNGQEIITNSEKVLRVRKNILELLISDHTGDCVAPCQNACPADTSCGAYAQLLAKGENQKAAELIYEKLALPASIGRICPHPCEKDCRRSLVDKPINIAKLKSFAIENGGDIKTKKAQKAQKTGKKISIVGGGAAGLSVAFNLVKKGHSVTIYEAREKMGGMLYFGVPEYRLPKSILQSEVDLIKSLGVEFKFNTRIGRDVSLENLVKNSDAVIVAIGAHKSLNLKIDGENLEGVISGVDFLTDVSGKGQAAFNTKYLSNIKDKIVAVVGGGDTAMDACRTAIRLGAKKVYNIYRRNKEQMPASKHEIIGAEQEGIEFLFLVNPLEVLGERKVEAVKLQHMQLGEKDSSGRSSFIAIDKITELQIDTLIPMIGLGVDTSGLEQLEKTKWGTIVADANTFLTNSVGADVPIRPIFAIGDATNNGASIAVEAIGEANRCSRVVDVFLTTGLIVPYKKQIRVKDYKTSNDFLDAKKVDRIECRELSPQARVDNFNEIDSVLDKKSARQEANRCLECGCKDYYNCKLLDYSNRYDIQKEKFAGEKSSHKPIDNSSPEFIRDMNKCILCEACVRVCETKVLGLKNRGFDTLVATEKQLPISKTNCNNCKKCISNCPTGAIVPKG